MTRYTPTWLQQGSYAASVDRRALALSFPNPTVNTGCAVSVASGMTLNIGAGICAIPTGNNTGTVVCASDATEQVTLAAAPASGSNRYDLVVCQARGNDLDGGANNDFLFTNVTGTAAASPSVPATPTNALSLAQVYIPGGSASVTAGNVTDVRPGGGSAGDYSGRMAYAQSTSNIAVSTTEAVALTTLPVWVPTAARLVRVEAFARNGNGPAGEAMILRIREGTTTAGNVVQDVVAVVNTSGTQAGTWPGAFLGRTYAPGLGLKQWVLTAQLTASIGNIYTATGSPIWLEVLDVGP